MNAKKVCYRFNLITSVVKRNGKTYNHHHISQLGFSYDDAISSAFFELKRKKTKLLKIHKATVLEIAWAYDHNLEFLNATLKDFPVEIPDDLNKALNIYLNAGF